MRTTTKGVLAVTLAGLVAVPALAQGPWRGQRGPRGGPGGGGRLEMATRVLDLSAEQQAAAKQLREQHRTAVEPLVKEAATLRREVRETLEAGGADAAAIGEKVIAGHELMSQVRESREDLEARFEALLTPEQRQTLQTLKQARERMRGPRGKRGQRGHGPGPGEWPEEPPAEAPPEEF